MLRQLGSPICFARSAHEYRWKRGEERRQDVQRVELSGLDLALLEIVRPLEDGSAPLANQALSHALDAGLGLFALRVEQDYLAEATAPQ